MVNSRSIITIHPSEIGGNIAAPGSKSVTIRAVAAGLLAPFGTVIHRPSGCEDARVALEIAGKMGAQIRTDGETIEMTGGLKPFEGGIHCGDSGLAIRLFSAIAALYDFPVEFTGDATLQKRPMNDLPGALCELGARVTTHKGYLPVRIQGPIKGGTATIDGSVSSQYMTGLLMALPLLSDPSKIHLNNLRSKPYIDLTMDVMASFGIEVQNIDYKTFVIPGSQVYSGGDYRVEGDWSGAAFMLAAGALQGPVKISNLDLKSRQADIRILDALEKMGARLSITSDTVVVAKSELKGFEFDITDCPDLAPPLVALAAHCSGISKLNGARRLQVKESNRGQVMMSEFRKLGVDIRLSDNILYIDGGTVGGGIVFPHQDHRIAMAASILALKAQKPVEVMDPECVNKSYPDFFRDLKILGGHIHE